MEKDTKLLKHDDQNVIDDFAKFMENYWETSGLNKETVEDHNKRIQVAQEIYNYLEKLPADIFIALYHKMIQSINYPFGINHCV